MTVEKNEEFEGEVLSLGTEGEGIVKFEGTTAFVPFCLKGERVRARALKCKDNIAYCKVVEIISKSPFRVVPPCPVFGKCGGCDLQHMAYCAQLDFKRDAVKSALKKIGGIDFAVSPTVPCDSEYRYRNKAVIPIGADMSGETVLGFYAPRSHRIVPVDDCLIQSEDIKNVIICVKNFSKIQNLKGYDGLSGQGDLKNIAVREIGGNYIFALVATRPIDLSALEKELKKYFKSFTLLLNVNPSRGNSVFSDDWHIYCGKGVFEAEECGVFFGAGANTFIQVNDGVRRKLYNFVLGEAKGLGVVALDLYSGGGLLTAMLAGVCEKAYGIEIVSEASARADEIARRNDLTDKMFNICGKVEEELPAILKKTEGKGRLIVSDPPRKGMERSAVRAISASEAEKVILISCNPSTLARDMGLLCGTLKERDNGELIKCGDRDGAYEVTSVTPFDMFPQTRHVETVAVLKRR